ncbi:hypothetical protein niasHT_002519 [Heterodera trifolii]|uniref:UBC core domain-containing protein n=1 Tax=Heterodera trifolii TaxID=157864 RepID=A0ABD2LW32_9BILA
MGSIRNNNNGNGRVTASSPTAATTDEDGAGPVEEFSPPTTEQLNMRCTGVKRLLKEAAELRHANEMFCARPMEDNLFEWHFSVRGPPDSPYAGGVYHGRIVLPADYPMKPPNLILMTPNGRFETNKKICLSISGYHPETWLPSWSIRTALLALVGFMPTHSAGALGGLECSREERRRLAIKSLDWRCATCGVLMRDALPALPPAGSTGHGQTERLLKEIRGTAGGTNKSTTDKQNAPLHNNGTSTTALAPSQLPPPIISSSTSSGSSSASFPAPPPPLSSVLKANNTNEDSSSPANQSPQNKCPSSSPKNPMSVMSSSSPSNNNTNRNNANSAISLATSNQSSSVVHRSTTVPSSSPSLATAVASTPAVGQQRLQQQQNARRSVFRRNALFPLFCIALLALLLLALVFRRIWFSAGSSSVNVPSGGGSPSLSSAGGGHLSL